MKVTVIVPTYRRTEDLARCLLALKRQTRACDELLVVARPDDVDTISYLNMSGVADGLPLQIVMSEVPGQVAALNRGLDAASGDVIAITDDDAAPWPDWIQRIVSAFESDKKLGGVGGRDWVYVKGHLLAGERTIVGKVTRSGKVIGNHHLGVGTPRDVDVLKGANMSYRREAISTLRFDTRLRGSGAQVHNDMAFSMSVKKAGWRLLYDPLVAVDHYPAGRFDEDRRDSPALGALENAAHNLHLTLQEQLPPLHGVFAWWWYMSVGTRVYPGIAHVILALTSSKRRSAFARWRAVRSGATKARRLLLQDRAASAGTHSHV